MGSGADTQTDRHTHTHRHTHTYRHADQSHFKKPGAHGRRPRTPGLKMKKWNRSLTQVVLPCKSHLPHKLNCYIGYHYVFTMTLLGSHVISKGHICSLAIWAMSTNNIILLQACIVLKTSKTYTIG